MRECEGRGDREREEVKGWVTERGCRAEGRGDRGCRGEERDDRERV